MRCVDTRTRSTSIHRALSRNQCTLESKSPFPRSAYPPTASYAATYTRTQAQSISSLTREGFLITSPPSFGKHPRISPGLSPGKSRKFPEHLWEKNSERGRYVRVVFLERSFCCNFCFFDDNAKSVTDTGVTMRTFPTLKGIIFNLVRKCTSYDTDIGRYLETYPFTKYTLGFDSNPDISISTRRRDLVVAPN